MTRRNTASGRPRRADARACPTLAGSPAAALPPPPAPTPLPPEALLEQVAEIRDLLDELAVIIGSSNAWGLRVLRRNVELALRSPRTLDLAENQMDFIEELAEAVWDGADSGFRHPVPTADTLGGTGGREARRQEVVERFDRLADQLCRAVEGWRGQEAAAAGETPLAKAAGAPFDHSI